MGNLKQKKSPKDAKQKEAAKEKSRRTSSRTTRRRGGVKIRVKLPSIEAYDKEISFVLQAPARVSVRLERLMGTDTVRILDTKFMAMLLERLEGEENQEWLQRSANRRKLEKSRYQRLAIEGFIEPTDDVQAVKNHPMYRVNRVIKELDKFENRWGGIPILAGYNKITPIEPFENDSAGNIFKTYNNHQQSGEFELLDRKSTSRFEQDDVLQNYFSREMEELGEMAEEEFETEFIPTLAEEDETEVNKSEETEGEETLQDEISELDKVLSQFLPESRKYNIPKSADISQFENFRSNLVDLVYLDEGSTIDELYALSDAILSVYDKENLAMDKFIVKLNQDLNKI